MMTIKEGLLNSKILILRYNKQAEPEQLNSGKGVNMEIKYKVVYKMHKEYCEDGFSILSCALAFAKRMNGIVLHA